ncbi:hypothetical protein [Selenihalanaerobacter shriftii]|uniref:Uncharacterized protein n=1 Tax=Selenihalanaerobacter shriftii TaxID=142842 RepID=A0A1T4PNW6_9FIRM|nr:hypothetical protein [Selenihalanaerobacter shriftii]SJZ93129.1 hypothetical protein SAMN02745118_02249 [Selenihalanaerobacter shriftii]
MSLMTGILLGAMVLYLIGYPIIVDEGVDEIDYDGRLTTLEADKELRKEAIFSELNEVELDYHMDKLSENDYKKIKERLQKLALEVMGEEAS